MPPDPQSPPRQVGRPGEFGDVPPDTRHRSIRLTDAEWEAVRALVKRMRNRTKPARKPPPAGL
jgi:hypothetical protein